MNWLNNSIYLLKMLDDGPVKNLCNQRWHGITNLLPNLITIEDMIKWERLQSSKLTNGEIPEATWMSLPSSIACNATDDAISIPRSLDSSILEHSLDIVIRGVARDGCKP